MFSWHAIPFIRLLVPFVLGVFVALYLPLNSLILYFVLIFCLLLYFRFNLKRNSAQLFKDQVYIGIIISLLFFLLGYLRTFCHNEQTQPNYFAGKIAPRYLELVVDDGIIEKAKFYRCYAKVIGVLDSSKHYTSSQGSILFYLRKGQEISKPEVGNHYLVNSKYTEIPSPANPEEFDYKRYLSYRNIYCQLFADSSNCVKSNITTTSIYRSACHLRDNTLTILKKNIHGVQALGVAEALLMGYKDDLDPDITSAFMRTGTLHVLAVSGMHAGIIYLILAFLTKPLSRSKWGKYLQVALLLVGIWLYAFMTGLSSSVLRASVMFSFIAIGKLYRHHVNVYNNIYASAFLLLIFNPRFIVDVGFQLSYLAVLGIIFIQPMVQKWYQPRFWLDKYIWSLVSVSVAAQLLTFPISLFYFHQFPNYFILSNLLIIPITSIILVGLILLVTVGSLPVLASFIGVLLNYLLEFNNWLVLSIDKLPYSFINGLNLNILPMLLLYVIICLVIITYIHRVKWAVKALLASVLVFFCIRFVEQYYQHKQKIIVVHQIKGHDVYSCIDGKTAYLLSDSNFLSNESSIKFFIEPFYWKQGITKIQKYDLNKSFVSTNIIYDKNVGFQFFDKFLTIDKILKENVQNNGILILKKYQKDNFKNLKQPPKYIKYGANTTFFEKRRFENAYFKRFGVSLKYSEYYILIRI
jgi:competence protein ComEC